MRKNSFQEKVIKVVSKIPEGKTLSYKQVANMAGSPKAYRAVGNIINKNHDPKVPCHRVVLSCKKIGKFNRGTKKKAQLLKEEGIRISKNYKILRKKIIR